MEKSTILFDGNCSFCNKTTQFIMKNDSKKQYDYSPLKSKKAKLILKKCSIKNNNKSLVLFKKNKCHTKSTATIKIMRNLRNPWPIFSGLIIIPEKVRDGVYEIISKNRHKINI